MTMPRNNLWWDKRKNAERRRDNQTIGRRPAGRNKTCGLGSPKNSIDAAVVFVEENVLRRVP
jgi:hypothetical protein